MKKGNSGSGSFGAPKPLPGQAGYKATATDLLKKDTEDMEARLTMLQERMKQQQMEAAASSMKAGGGATWGSARTDKGSVSSYGKQVKEQIKKKLDSTVSRDSLLRGTSNARRVLMSTEIDFRNKDVNEWEVNDVSAWLADIQLKEYISAFAQNAINGSVLLDISNDDLDYMGIKALGHRKIILKSVESLRNNGHYTSSSSPINTSTAQQRMPADILRTTSNPNLTNDRNLHSKSLNFTPTTSNEKLADTVEAHKPESKEVKTTHWSHLEPLSNNKVSNPMGMGVANAADESDFLDEAAERQAFMDAVAEWRKADAAEAGGERQPVRIEREYLTGPSDKKQQQQGVSTTAGSNTSLAGAVGGGGALWKNPFGGDSVTDHVVDDTPSKSQEVLDEAAERKAFQEAVMEWRRGPSTSTAAVTGSQSQPSVTAAVASSSSPTKGGAMFNGILDEDKEHEAFVKAVDAWRSRDPNAPVGSFPATQSMAERLAKELEAERAASSLRLKQQKEDAERRLREANLELTKLRSAREREDKCQVYDDEDTDELDEIRDSSSEGMYTYSSAPTSYAMPVSARNVSATHEVMGAGIVTSPRAGATASRTSSSAAAAIESVASPPKTARSGRGWTEDDYELAGQGNNTVQLALVESKIGDCKTSDSAEDSNYCVEEADSDIEEDEG